MVLFVNEKSKIYAYNEVIPKEESRNYTDAIWYEGEFSFLDGEEKEGFSKTFKWDGEKPVLEYEPIPESPVPEPTINEKIYEAVSKSQDEIRQEGADIVMEELMKRGLMV